MKLLITGVAGFVGSTIARAVVENGLNWELHGIDCLSRRGSERNIDLLKKLGVQFTHGDLRIQSDVDSLPTCDWIIDAAANPSILAGVDGKTSSRQLIEHNLNGTINLLEYCSKRRAGFILLSTSRVYSIQGLAKLDVRVESEAFAPCLDQNFPLGISEHGIDERYSTSPPVSLYGSTKVTSEQLALEYGEVFDFPVWINRCGVMAGAGQFGNPGQGIFAYWINAHLRRKPLKYIGFEGSGYQVRDCLHPRDLITLFDAQIQSSNRSSEKVFNVSGGKDSALSLYQLTKWCDERFGKHPIESDANPRPFDLPWVVLNSEKARSRWGWMPQTSASEILNEISSHALDNSEWLQFTGA